MAAPKWFDSATYFNNKLADVQEVMGPQYTAFNLSDDFKKAGFSTDADSLYKHFVNYGNNENLSPNKYFDADYYFQSKAQSVYGHKYISQVTEDEVAAVKSAFAKAGLSAWDHYTIYGMKEEIDPNANFSTSKYLESKLAKVQETDPSYTKDQLKADFKAAGLNAVEHYFEYGVNEGLVNPIQPASHALTAQYLTTGMDNLVGTSSIDSDKPGIIDENGDLHPDDVYDDYFHGEVKTLQSEDKVDGLGGEDTLYSIVDVDASNGAKAGSINPTVKNVEKVFFQSQIGDGDEVVEHAEVSAVIDADRISLAHKGEEGYTTKLFLGSVNSRADLRVEDVRHFSNQTVVRFADADPEVDYHVYFDPQHLKANDASTSGMLLVELMDVLNADIHKLPLETNPYNEFIFKYDNGSTSQLVDLKLQDDLIHDSATYDDLVNAFNNALKEQYPELVDVLEIVKGIEFTAEATSSTDGKTHIATGYYVQISSKDGTVSCKLEDGCGWKTDKVVPPDTNYDTRVTGSEDTTCPLIEVEVEVTNVGRVQWDDAYENCLPDDVIKGSNAGDLEIGSMSQRSGIERMDVFVDEGSWLAGLYSTNNTLRYVTVTARDINDDGIMGNKGEHRSQDAHMADDTVNGQLFIGTWEGKLDDQGTYTTTTHGEIKDNLTWADKAKLLTANGTTTGLNDVAVFDAEASGYTGDINVAAQITAASYHKYLKGVDGIDDHVTIKNAPLEAYDGNFSYLTGSGDDVINMTVNGGVAADVDFKMNIKTNDGKDLVAFQYDQMSTNQSYDNKYLQQVQINTGNDDDTVWFYGGKRYDNGGRGVQDYNGGAVKVDGGTGNDAIYVNQINYTTGGFGSGISWGPDSYNAVFVMNANDTSINVNNFNGATNNNNIETGASTFVADQKITSLTTLSVTVNFKGFTAKADVAQLSSTKDSVTAEEVNQAIIKAVTNDPVLSKLIVAKDGAGHSLIIESLINGEMYLGNDEDHSIYDLEISFSAKANDTTIAGFSMSEKVNLNQSGPTIQPSPAPTLAEWYNPKFATPENTENGGIYDGFDSNIHSQAVVNGGSDNLTDGKLTPNDVIVLGNNGDGTETLEVDFGDLSTPRDGATLTVTVDGKVYTSTWNEKIVEWSDFETSGKDPESLSKVLKYDLSQIENESGAQKGVLSFEKLPGNEDATITAATETVRPAEKEVTEITKPTDASYYTAKFETKLFDQASDKDSIVLTINFDGDKKPAEVTATHAKDGSWTVSDAPRGFDITVEDKQNEDKTYNHTEITVKDNLTVSSQSVVNVSAECVNGEGDTDEPSPTWNYQPCYSKIHFGDLSEKGAGVVDGNKITVTLDDPSDPDPDADPLVYESVFSKATGWSQFTIVSEDNDPYDPYTVAFPADPKDWSDITVTVGYPREFDKPEADTYLGKAVTENAEISGDDASDYLNTGRDIIVLEENFGNDTVVDFQHGIDQVDVEHLGITVANPATAASLSSLSSNTVWVGTVSTPESGTGIYTQKEVTKLFTDKVIQFSGDGTAVAFLDDGDKNADNHVYTVVQVTKAGAEVMGSLALAEGEEITAIDVFGIDQLIDDPELIQTA